MPRAVDAPTTVRVVGFFEDLACRDLPNPGLVGLALLPLSRESVAAYQVLASWSTAGCKICIKDEIISADLY